MNIDAKVEKYREEVPDLTPVEERAIRDDAAAAVKTVIKYYYNHDLQRKTEAREALRRAAKCSASLQEDGMADVVLENLWNILVGND